MTKLKYAGLCAAGIIVDIICIFVDSIVCVKFDHFLINPQIVFVLIGLGLCIGAGFAHVAFMNIIMEKPVMRAKWYLLLVFVVPSLKLISRSQTRTTLEIPYMCNIC